MIFHLAIPTIDVLKAIEFYTKLGARVGRQSEDWAIFDLHGMQLVVHKTTEAPNKASMYPRHFGFVLDSPVAFDHAYNNAKMKGLKFFQENFTRFRGEPEQHETFFLQDPSNNVIEFKFYKNKASIFGAEK